MLDTLRYYETPEGIDLELHLAGLIPRVAAWSIDILIHLLIYTVVFSVFAIIGGGVGQGLILISIFLVSWFYPVFFEVFRQGATPGKKAMGIHVVHDNGTPVSWSSSFIRNLLRSVDFMPFLYGFGILSLLMNRDFKRLGDIVAGTVVVYSDTSIEAREIPKATPRPLPVALTLTEQRGILDFAERSQQISPQRREELANILSTFTGNKDKQAVESLYQYANWLNKG